MNMPRKIMAYGLIAGVLLSALAVGGLLVWSWQQAPTLLQQRAQLVPHTMASLPPIVVAPPPPVVAAEVPTTMPLPSQVTTDKTVGETTVEQDAPPTENIMPTAAMPPDAAQLTPPVLAANTMAAAWQTNAASFDAADTRPRLALMVADLGLAASVTDAAISSLPPQISLSFWANAPDVAANMAKARADGHEVFLAVPMEPANFPQNDAGPNSLLTTLTDVENVARLQAHLRKAQNYVGIVPAMGEQFVTARQKLAPIMAALQQQGLMVVDSTQAPQSFITAIARTQNMPFIKIDRVIDAAQGDEAWQAQLNGLVQLAKTNGRAAAVIVPYPAAFKQLAPFLADLPNKGIALAPMSALVK